MFEFSKRSRKILELLSQSEGKRLNADFLSPEHILLALLIDKDSVAVKIMKNLGINFERLRKEIEQSSKKNVSTITLGQIPINNEYKKIVEISKEEAKKLKNLYIGTEHLLLAIFKAGNAIGINTLIRAGIDYNVIKNEIHRILGIKVGAGKPLKQKPKVKNILEEFSQDLTTMAERNLLDPVIGRDDEINRVIRILSRKRKNNPVLIGDAGVGKTAIVEGLAQKIYEKKVTDNLFNHRVLSLDMASIIAGTKYRGEFEDRLKKIINEIIQRKNIIIFLDELHTIIGAGAAEGAIDAANILKPALARGELQCIGATTLNEYRAYIEKDSALVRRFQSVYIDEPNEEDTLEILLGLKKSYENHHKVIFSDGTLQKAIILSNRYINDRFFPDKAIDIIDEAAAMAKLDHSDTPEDIEIMENNIQKLNTQKNHLVMEQKYEEAAGIRDLIIKKNEELAFKLNNWRDKKDEYLIEVQESHISAVISESTGIPVENLDKSEKEKLLHMEKELTKRVIGQKEAISAISRAIRRSRIGLSDDDRILGAFIFLGPTGVGKTELAKALSEFLFDEDRSLIRLDMSEYMEKHSVSKLIGAPPGYIGYDEGGQLTEKIKRRPFSVLLLDEIEKAHPDIFNILLQVFEEGELTDGTGEIVSFRDVIIIMTSNVGSRFYSKLERPGFNSQLNIIEPKNEKVDEELNKIFSPELINRIDEIIHFKKLTKKNIDIIVKTMLEKIKKKLIKNNKIELIFASPVEKHIAKLGFDDKSGARNLRRVIQRELEDKLSYELLKGNFKSPCKINVFIKEDSISFTKVQNKKGKKNKKSDKLEDVLKK